MPTLHFFRWVDQLKEENYEVYWFDITDGATKIPRINWVDQITDWKLRWNYPGRIFLKKQLPNIYRSIGRINEKSTVAVFEEKLKEIQPDIVHSFALYVSCTPIIGVMEKYKDIKWIYSSWGSDLFYFQNQPEYLKDIKRVLPRVDYLFTDCHRDYNIAKKHGFDGEFLGAFPGGGGFDFTLMDSLKKDISKRKDILIKGYQGRSGRAIEVLKSLLACKRLFSDYNIVIFGAGKEVLDYIHNSEFKSWTNLQVNERIKHDKVLELMGTSVVYVGNSDSDGTPNTLLEAMCMDVIPVQSNPGGATQELIEDGKNGFLIQDCEDILHIQSVLTKVISTISDSYVAIVNENRALCKRFEYNMVKSEVLKKYQQVLS
ncbi:hypothetical protein NBRC110019_10860 [Neptunitalea chrysea]|uniref:Uncharacterized protein n=2 Tax=Neptunitalea chrysea TaxID=1647581 RepID=A0A9W6B671_9FLAO|nr:hypothetical protein NBRC110019_10860 [Neptunitalea chrysea]